MELLMAKQSKSKTPIPVIGMESDAESKPKSNGEDRSSEIALRAYYKAEARGYQPGYEIQDWLDAEADVMKKTKGGEK
jgi:Protein of unknown function (DUF2934)